MDKFKTVIKEDLNRGNFKVVEEIFSGGGFFVSVCGYTVCDALEHTARELTRRLGEKCYCRHDFRDGRKTEIIHI